MRHRDVTITEAFHLVSSSGEDVFQKTRIHLEIPGTRRVTRSKFHSEDPHILSTTVEDVVVVVSWHPTFVHP
jgi:hypothetical protein